MSSFVQVCTPLLATTSDVQPPEAPISYIKASASTATTITETNSSSPDNNNNNNNNNNNGINEVSKTNLKLLKAYILRNRNNNINNNNISSHNHNHPTITSTQKQYFKNRSNNNNPQSSSEMNGNEFFSPPNSLNSSFNSPNPDGEEGDDDEINTIDVDINKSVSSLHSYSDHGSTSAIQNPNKAFLTKPLLTPGQKTLVQFLR